MDETTDQPKDNGHDPGTPTEEGRECYLHMTVPEAAKRQAKVAAAQSGMPFKHYMTRLMLQAKPMSSTNSG